MNRRLLIQLSLSVLCLNTKQTAASLGDDLSEFQQCVKMCDIVSCDGSTGKYPELTEQKFERMIKDQAQTHVFQTLPLSLDLRLLGWECYPNCDYQCQRIVTRERMAAGEEVYQFHGKWPFIRVLGIQELFSTLFSIGNFFPHYWGFKLMYSKYKREMKFDSVEFATLYWSYLVMTVVTMCAWTFSTLFHLRDTWTREQLDYYFAGMTVISGLYGVGVRVFKLYLTKNNFKRHLFALVIILCYCGHVTRLVIDWSYTYNMRANVFCGVIQYVLWYYHSLISFHKLRKSKDLLKDLKDPEVSWALTPILIVMSVGAAMSFEMFDFPPLFELLDAHALWHFFTIWPAMFWYPYMVKDVEDGLKDKKYE